MEFDSLLNARRSIREFSKKPVSEDDVMKVLEAATLAPSSGNLQPWEFILITSDEDKKKLREFCEESDKEWLDRVDEATRKKLSKKKEISLDFLTDAPCIILCFGKKNKEQWRESVWMAIALMTLKAADMELGTIIYTPPRSSAVNELFNISHHLSLAAVCPIGVPAKVPKARPRTPVAEKTKTVEQISSEHRLTREFTRRTDDPILSFMKRIPVLSYLSDVNREELRRRFFIKKFDKGEAILNRGEPGTYYYIIANGLVEVLIDDGMGNEKVVSVLSSGECFGEMSILSGEPTSAAIRAGTQVFCLALKSTDFLNLVEEYPSINVAITKLIATRLRKTNLSLVEATVLQGITGRLSMISLSELCQALSVNQRSGILEMSHIDDSGAKIEGSIFFSQGQVTNAVLPDVSGDEAFYTMLAWPDGEFIFRQEEVEPDFKVSADTMGLLMEGMRRMDEAQIKDEV